jgi:hypothetical protein
MEKGLAQEREESPDIRPNSTKLTVLRLSGRGAGGCVGFVSFGGLVATPHP